MHNNAHEKPNGTSYTRQHRLFTFKTILKTGQKADFLNIIRTRKLHLKIQSVPRSKHSVSVTQTSQLTLYREITAVCSQIHTKHINTLCGQNVEFLNVKLVDPEL